jgi:recombination protein RecT
MSVTTLKPQSAVEQIRNQLLAMTPEFKNALPSHIKPEKFQRVIMTVVQQTPALLNADRRSLFASCIKCAADGLIPDGREAALVMFGNQVQYMPMLAGIQKRARNSGNIAGLIAQVVYENDDFVQKPDDFDHPIHHRPPSLGTDRGKMVGAYAMAKLTDGTIVAEVMDIPAIEKVRNVSRAKNAGPWKDWYEEMARKTVFRRLSKWLPMDAETDDLIRHDDDVSGLTEQAGAGVSAPTIDGDAFEAANAGSGDTAPHDPETGEITNGKHATVEHKPDPAAGLIADYAGAASAADIQATDANVAVQAEIKRLLPADQKRVAEARGARLAALGASQKGSGDIAR